MDIYLFILFFLIIFMLHNLEEIITIEKWFKNTYPRIRGQIPLPVQKLIDGFANTTAAQFAIAVLMISLVASLLLIITVTTQHYFLFLGLNMLFALNIFTHPIQAILLRCYTPGVWTTLLLILPYNIIFFYHFYIEDLLTMNMILGGSVVMFICMPFVYLGHKIAEKWK
ncbi:MULTISPECIES: HXXEE domain-containing protein [Clostridia]|uniref:HXXEE domain-containing protein n=1 Tax=Clostridia TaxID=186801 RepID=UPI000EA070C6|nr:MULTISPECIES: HXXEE domain-containing protein [Clostridia]NBJ71519.1 HXXEE domain-containing protein [Roseburia sp. 1XD42-34]RKI74269.1 HXXEE domain-containing protein [Clostridium sp. 1xD42-85]